MIDILLIILTILALTAGSFMDLKKREVPDWISYGLIFAALGFRLLYSIFNKDYFIFLTGLFGFGIFFALSNLFYYLKQWGGGDAKILMGMGAVLGFNQTLILFLLFLIFIGAIYGILFSIYLAIKNKYKFKIAFRKSIKEFKYLLIAASLFLLFGIYCLFSLNDPSLSFLLFGVSVIFFIGMISFTFVRAVEESCFMKRIHASKLTEGDWVVETIKIGNKVIINEKNLGITKAQINKLKNYKKPILVKTGIPFIPAFLLAYIALIIAKNKVLSLI